MKEFTKSLIAQNVLIVTKVVSEQWSVYGNINALSSFCRNLKLNRLIKTINLFKNP